jgi:CspA family cold shock protein
MDGFRTLRQGSRVNFDLAQGPKGQLAHNIRAFDAPAPGAADVPRQAQATDDSMTA